MKDTQVETVTDERFVAIARELRFIRILLYGLLLLVATSMSSAINRDLPIIVLLVGVLIPIVWAINDAMVKRSRRAQHEAEEFRRLSGRVENPTG